MQLHIDKALMATGIFDNVTVRRYDDKGAELVLWVRGSEEQDWANFLRKFAGKITRLSVYKFELGSEDEEAVAAEIVQQIAVRKNKEIVKDGGIPIGLNSFYVGKLPLDVAAMSGGGFGRSSPSKSTKKFVRAITAAAKKAKNTKRPKATPRRVRKRG